jgi:phosphonate dehydrogenase
MSAKPRIVLTHRVFEETLQLLEPVGTIVPNPTGKTLPREIILQQIGEADAVMAFMPDLVDAEFLNAAPNLKIVAGALKGCDNFDIHACTARGVWATIVPDLLTVPTAELAIGLAIALSRHVRAGDLRVRSGDFSGWRPDLYGTGFAGSIIGIVGMGRIGRALAQRLRAFDATLIYTDTQRPAPSEDLKAGTEYVNFETLLSASDFVFLAVPLTEATRHLIDGRTLARMKRTAFLINPCRGSVVDEEAVADALSTNGLAGYAADVFAFEDWALPERPREIPFRLRAQENRVIFTPHLGSAVVGIRKEIERSAAESIAAALRGEVPPGAVNALAVSPAAIAEVP